MDHEQKKKEKKNLTALLYNETRNKHSCKHAFSEYRKKNTDYIKPIYQFT